MSILVNSTTRVITQGMTGKTGAYHTRACRAYANADNFVAGVNPRKAGTDMDGIPIFGTVAEAKKRYGSQCVCHLCAARRSCGCDFGSRGSAA